MKLLCIALILLTVFSAQYAMDEEMQPEDYEFRKKDERFDCMMTGFKVWKKFSGWCNRSEELTLSKSERRCAYGMFGTGAVACLACGSASCAGCIIAESVKICTPLAISGIIELLCGGCSGALCATTCYNHYEEKEQRVEAVQKTVQPQVVTMQ